MHTGTQDLAGVTFDGSQQTGGLDRSSPAMLPLAFAGACAFMNLFATQPILPLLANLFHASKLEVSLTVTGPAVAIGLAAPVLGRFSDRHGRKRTILWAALLLSLFTLLAATSKTLAQLIGWRFLQGVFTPGVFSVTIAYINEEWPASRIGHAMAVFGTGGVVGSCFGRTMSGVIASHWSWRWGLLVLGIVNLAWTLWLAKLLPREKKFTTASHSSSVALLGSYLRNRPLLATYAVGFCIMFSLLALFTYVNFHLAAPPYFLDSAALGFIFLVYLVGGVTTPVVGRWIDKIGLRNTALIASAFGVAGVLLTLGRPLLVIVLGLTVFSAASFIVQASANSHVGMVVEHSRALASGLRRLESLRLAGCGSAIFERNYGVRFVDPPGASGRGRDWSLGSLMPGVS
jgi:predicted MFS family arabinose efflux permease